jgi:thiosulfate/3-mercaptopyruvate sulfurtransferase
MITTIEQMEAAVGDGSTCIVNSLSPDNHSGADDSYGRPGHIPGASNVFAVALLDIETHRYRPAEELAALFDYLPVGEPAITYCGGGIAATSDAFVLTELLARKDVSVYDGSLSEWLGDPTRPLVTTD